jgi:hypothetical protein
VQHTAIYLLGVRQRIVSHTFTAHSWRRGAAKLQEHHLPKLWRTTHPASIAVQATDHALPKRAIPYIILLLYSSDPADDTGAAHK